MNLLVGVTSSRRCISPFPATTVGPRRLFCFLSLLLATGHPPGPLLNFFAQPKRGEGARPKLRPPPPLRPLPVALSGCGARHRRHHRVRRTEPPAIVISVCPKTRRSNVYLDTRAAASPSPPSPATRAARVRTLDPQSSDLDRAIQIKSLQ